MKSGLDMGHTYRFVTSKAGLKGDALFHKGGLSKRAYTTL